MKKSHDALKTVYDPTKSSGATPLLSADGSTLLTDKGARLERWIENYHPSTIDDNALNKLQLIRVQSLA